MIVRSLLNVSWIALVVHSFSIQSRNSVSSPKGGNMLLGPRNSLATDKVSC